MLGGLNRSDDAVCSLHRRNPGRLDAHVRVDHPRKDETPKAKRLCRDGNLPLDPRLIALGAVVGGCAAALLKAHLEGWRGCQSNLAQAVIRDGRAA